MFKISPEREKMFTLQENYYLNFLILAVFTLNYIDAVTTQIGIVFLGAKEMIPTMSYMMELFGNFWWWVKILIVGCVCYEFYHTKNETTILLVLSLFLSVVIGNVLTIGRYILF